MDREELVEAINRGPVRVTMNDGSKYVIESRDSALVGDLTCYILIRSDDGKLRARHLSLVGMTEIEELAET